MLEKSHDTPGWKLTFAAGFIPFFAGLMLFVTGKIGVLASDGDWPIGIGRLDFSFAEIQAVSHDSGAFLKFISDIGSVNTVMSAVAVVAVSYFALKKGERWAWWFLLACLVWVGFSDAYNTAVFYFETSPVMPLPLMPSLYVALMAAGLFRSRQAIFSTGAK